MRIAFTHNLQHDHDDESQAEFDRQETVDDICAALRDLGHDVTAIDVGAGSVSAISARLEAMRPDLVFNTAEGTHGRFREALWPAVFDALGLPFTGSDAWVCAVTLDKQLTKLMVQQAGVPTPRWVHVATAHDVDACAGLRFPLIAKPNAEGSSKGITTKSVIEDMTALRALCDDLLARFPAGVLVEEFIVGKDVVVPWLQAASPATGGVLSPCSYRFDASIIGERKYTLYDYELKCVKSEAVEVQVPADIDDATAQELMRLSKIVYDTLGMRDLGRIDWRIDEQGRPTFIEVNALPSLEPGAGIYLAGALAGLSTTKDVIGAVVQSAVTRHGLATSTTTRASKRIGLAYNLKRLAPKSAADDDRDAEYDAQSTIDALAAAIESHGHEVVRLEATPAIVRALPDAHVDLVFNVSEAQQGRTREAQIPALLDLLRIPHTGSDAATMAICLDKELCKRVVGAAGVAVPRGVLMRGDEPASVLAGLRFPLIAKPNAEGSSKGVLPECVVDDEPALRALLAKLHAKYRQPILVEEFLPGREFTVAVLADPEDGTKPVLLPPMELVYTDPSTKHPVYAFEDKLDWSKGIRYDRPAVLDEPMRARIEHVVKGAWHALGCRDVARFDLRCDAAGEPRFIEANPLPGLTPGWSDLCLIAEADGLDYRALIGRILAPALHRAALSTRTA
jgi:D-alanine-D-alanine ligase